MDIELFNFVGYFIAYLLVGFVFFYFIMFKKPGSNIVSTICMLIIIISVGIGFMSAIHLAIINLFILILAFWFAYIIIKMNKQDKLEREMSRKHHEFDYHTRMLRKTIEKELSEEDKDK
ncbi:MAG: hypothetical protein K9N07_07425 [Candidatus Cloacimonetes bacterium]|nr:hypothetical protein [Candidatus Cloacimonadota bacterium]